MSDADQRHEHGPVAEPGFGLRRSKEAVRLSLYAELLILDGVAIIAGFAIAGWIRGTSWMSPEGVNLSFPTTAIYLLLAFYGDAYSLRALRNRADSFRLAFRAFFGMILVLLLLGFFVKASELVSRLAFGIGIVAAFTMLSFVRWFFHGYAQRRSGGALTEELLIVDGVDVPKLDCRHRIDAQAERITPDLANPRMLGRLATLMRHFDRVVVAAAPERQHAWSLLLKGADLAGEIVILNDDGLGAIGVASFSGMDTVQVSRGSLDLANRAKKRLLDLTVTVPVLVFLAPLLIVVAIAIKLDSPGPVFFRQPRVGRGNRMFEILKFRSMKVEAADPDGAKSTQREDARITRVGAFIRRTSIDELPQLINVLRSDMSLVGPRPHALGSLAGDKLFWEVNERYWLRHALKPGITGLAQVRGFRGATHHREDLENRLQADLEYLNGWRLWRDVTILVRTLRVLKHSNAY